MTVAASDVPYMQSGDGCTTPACSWGVPPAT